jgi:hypothetical protein
VERRGEEHHDRGQRRDDRADNLRPERIGRRQRRQLLDGLGRHRRALEHTALDREHLCLGGLVERLRDGDGVALALEEGDRGRPIKQREELRRAGRLGRPPRERVLDDREAGPVREQVGPELVDVGDRQPAVVGDDQRLRRP